MSSWEQIKFLLALKHRPRKSQDFFFFFLAEREWNVFSRASQRFRETQSQNGVRGYVFSLEVGSLGWNLVQSSFLNSEHLWDTTLTSEGTETSDCSESTSTYLFKIAAPPLLPVHHIVENRNHDIAEIWLGYQGYFQEGANQGRNEMKLVLS